MHTSVCFKIVIECKFATYLRFKFKDFPRTFKHLICFQALSRALSLLFKIQAFSRISQAHYWTLPPLCRRRWQYAWRNHNTSTAAVGSLTINAGSGYLFAIRILSLDLLKSLATITCAAHVTETGDKVLSQWIRCVPRCRVSPQYNAMHKATHTHGTIYRTTPSRIRCANALHGRIKSNFWICSSCILSISSKRYCISSYRLHHQQNCFFH